MITLFRTRGEEGLELDLATTTQVEVKVKVLELVPCLSR